MKRLLFSFVVVICSSSFLSQQALGFDTTAPSVESCEINVKNIPATGGKVTVTAQIKSVYDLDRTPIIRMFNASYDRWIADVKSAQLTSGDLKSGTWTSTFEVLTDRKPDRYYVTFDALWDKGGNSNKMSFICKDAYVDYGGYKPSTPTPIATVTAKPTTAPTVTVTTTPVPATTVYISNPVNENLKALISSLNSEISQLKTKIKKICAVKPKPKGC
jgi:hypothetical protein